MGQVGQVGRVGRVGQVGHKSPGKKDESGRRNSTLPAALVYNPTLCSNYSVIEGSG